MWFDHGVAWHYAMLAGLVMLSLAAPADAAQPGIACARARTAVEQRLCTDPVLKQQDQAMTEHYAQVLKEAVPAQRGEIRHEQARWLRDLKRCNDAQAVGEWPRDPAVRQKQAIDDCVTGRFWQYREKIGPYTETLAHPPFPARRFPFLPHLLASHQPRLCARFLDAAIRDYRSWRSAFLEPDFSLDRNEAIKWDAASPQENSADRVADAIAVKRITFGEGGDALLVLTFGPNYQIDHNSALFLQLPASPNKLLDQLATAKHNNIDVAGLMPVLLKTTIFGPENPIEVLEFQHRYYVFDDDWENLDERGGSLALQEIHADGSLTDACRVGFAPSVAGLDNESVPDDEAPSPQRRLDAPAKDLIAAPDSLAQLARLIRQMQGLDTSTNYLRFLDWAIDRSNQATIDAVARPWLVAHQPGETLAAEEAGLAQWGFDALSNFRKVRAFRDARVHAQADLAQFYVSAYGLAATEADAAARNAIGNIIETGFDFSNAKRYAGPNAPLDPAVLKTQTDMLVDGATTPEKATTALRRALLLGMSVTAIDRLIDLGAALYGTLADPPEHFDSMEPAIDFALEQPDLLEHLLARGAKVNEGNEFGKTALMYAAQYDLLPAVQILLAHGADVSRHTEVRDRGPFSPYVIAHDHRTALMYAAQNASAPVIDALLAAGATPDDPDTKNDDAGDYFALNKIVAGVDRDRLAKALPVAPP